MSVVAMAAVCYWCYQLNAPTGVVFDTYVDNWSWSSPSCGCIEDALPKSLHFLQALALPVDGRNLMCGPPRGLVGSGGVKISADSSRAFRSRLSLRSGTWGSPSSLMAVHMRNPVANAFRRG